MNKTLKNIGLVVGTLAVLYAINEIAPESYLNKEDIDNSTWKKVNNKSGRIWKSYMSENIPHNQVNWGVYQQAVKEKNPKGLEGTIFLPDLDGDGFVWK